VFGVTQLAFVDAVSVTANVWRVCMEAGAWRSERHAFFFGRKLPRGRLMQKIRRALLSVHDNAVSCRSRSRSPAWPILLSTGGTAAALTAAGIPVLAVSSYTGAPEISAAASKTLHPKIAGGLLARRDDPAHARSSRRTASIPST
jgi:hypothetical protein